MCYYQSVTDPEHERTNTWQGFISVFWIVTYEQEIPPILSGCISRDCPNRREITAVNGRLQIQLRTKFVRALATSPGFSVVILIVALLFSLRMSDCERSSDLTEVRGTTYKKTTYAYSYWVGLTYVAGDLRLALTMPFLCDLFKTGIIYIIRSEVSVIFLTTDLSHALTIHTGEIHHGCLSIDRPHSPYLEASSDAVLECICRVSAAPDAQPSIIDERKCATFDVGRFSHQILDALITSPKPG